MKKGFTLVELLAIIVVLSIIILVAAPAIKNVIDNSKKKSFMATCNQIYNSYDTYKMNEELKNNKALNVIFDFASKRSESEVIDDIIYESISKLKIKGDIPYNGTYKILNGKKELILSNDVYTCIIDKNRSEILDGSIADNDITNPILEKINISNTTKSIIVDMNAYEPDGIIEKYHYIIDGKEIISKENKFEFKNLKSDFEYEIKVFVQNKSGLKSNVIKENVKTLKIEDPQIKKIGQSPNENSEYSITKTIEIDFDEKEGLDYYFKTNVEAKIKDETILSICGNFSEPKNCVSGSSSKTVPNIWYKSTQNVYLIFKENAVIETITTDEINKKISTPYNVDKIDNVIPSIDVSVNGKIANFVFDDDIGIMEYGVNNSDVEEPTYIKLEGKTASFEATEPGIYYVWLKDTAGNKNNSKFEILSSAFCSFNVGKTWSYNYTGTSQRFEVPCSGKYKLEVYGAQGGASPGGNGGYSIGYKNFSKGNNIYVVVGGAGVHSSGAPRGGYNGGGSGRGDAVASGGGGATHMASIDGTLASIGKSRISNIYIVAGGGGGHSCGRFGGSGGGTNGGNSNGGTGGTQSYAGSSLQGSAGGFGYGGSAPSNSKYAGGGGGGGLYGGGAGREDSNGKGGGGGGSGYIGGVDNGSTSNGNRSGNGYAVITLMSIDQ